MFGSWIGRFTKRLRQAHRISTRRASAYPISQRHASSRHATARRIPPPSSSSPYPPSPHGIAPFAISPDGVLAIVTAIVCLAIWVLTRWHECLAIGLVISSAVAMCMAISTIGSRTRIVIEVPEHAVVADSKFILTCIVTNHGRRKSSTSRLRIPVRSRRESFDDVIVTVPMLRPGQSRSIDVALDAPSRSVLTFGPIRMPSCDPFGFVRPLGNISDKATLHVHPVTVPVAIPNIGPPLAAQDIMTDRCVDDGFEFHALRAYRDGDDPRNIHWTSFAKTGIMMVRQHCATHGADTALMLDASIEGYADPEEFELAVAMYASIGASCLDEHYPLAVSIAGRIGSHTNRATFLDECSTIQFQEPGQNSQSTMTISDQASSVGRPTNDDNVEPSSHAAIIGASRRFLIVGSAITFDRILAFFGADSTAASRIVIRACSGARCSVITLPSCIMVVAGTLTDLQTALAVTV